MNKKIVTFGEIMLRLAPKGYYRFNQENSFEATYGGGEANVAVSLANYGLQASFVTKLPNHAIGMGAIKDLRAQGVDTTKITLGGERVGIYFLEKGASQRASQVIYDRAYSAIALASLEDFDFDEIFKDADWFHFTGITPALGGDLPKICEAACKAAKANNVTISCDLNYRKKLWSTKEAQMVMSKLAQYIDVCIANEEDAEKVFGISATTTDITSGEINHQGYIEVAKQLQEKYGFAKVAITLRESISANDNNWSAMLYTDNQAYFSKRYSLHIVDRVGGGDSFAGGLIYSLLQNFDNQKTIEFASAASALKHSIEGDYNRVSVTEVETLLKGDGSGRVQR
ncbi:MAG: PfkB family carbohydrate kinase [Erysipelotrichaceae bacterium]